MARTVSKKYIQEMDRIYVAHIKKYGYRSMTVKELEALGAPAEK